MAWAQFRTVIEDVGVSEAVDRACNTWPRFRDAWDGLHWLLARNGDTLGVQNVARPNLRLFAVAADSLAKTPKITLIYSVTQNEIIIHDFRAKDQTATIVVDPP